MTSVCRIYNVDTKSLVEEHKIGSGGKINEKKDFVFVGASRNVQWDYNADKSEYDIFAPELMRYMKKILKDMIKPVVHGHVLCSSLQFAFF